MYRCNNMAVNWVQWLPTAFKFSSVLHFIMATVMASIWHVYIFGVYLVLETHVCQYSHIRRLYQKVKSCLASAQRKRFEEDDSVLLQADISVTPTAQLGAFLECSWAGRICVLQNEAGGERGQFEWMQILSEDLGNEAEDGCERKRRGRQVRTPHG